MTIKIKVGSLHLTETRDQDLPQEFAAWHQIVRIEPGSYDVFAYLDWEHGGGYRLHSLSAECEGVTISSNFRSHVLGHWGASDNNRNGQRATAHVHLPTYGVVGAASSILAQAELCDALVRVEWDPREHDPGSTSGRMWRFAWNAERKPIILQQARYGGGLSLAAFEDLRRFRVDAAEMSPDEARKLDLHFQHLFSVDQLAIGETAAGWSFRDKRSIQVTRLA